MCDINHVDVNKDYMFGAENLNKFLFCHTYSQLNVSPSPKNERSSIFSFPVKKKEKKFIFPCIHCRWGGWFHKSDSFAIHVDFMADAPCGLGYHTKQLGQDKFRRCSFGPSLVGWLLRAKIALSKKATILRAKTFTPVFFFFFGVLK